jgi:hypothetical protein
MNRKAEYFNELALRTEVKTLEQYLKADGILTDIANTAKEFTAQEQEEIRKASATHKEKVGKLNDLLRPLEQADEIFRTKMKSFAVSKKLTVEMLPQETKAIPVVKASWRLTDALLLPEEYLKTVPDMEKIEAVFKSLGNLTEIPGVEISETVEIKRLGGQKNVTKQ